MSFEISINGRPFTLWESATVERSIDSNCGVFRFSNSSTVPVSEYPVKTGDFVEILISGVRKIAGFIDHISASQDDGLHTIEISGRDKIQDLIDSSVPDSAKVTEGPVTLKRLCENVISALNADIKVIEQVPDIAGFSSDDLQVAGSGDTCMAYLVSFARKRQVYLVPDGSSNLIIFRPDRLNKSTSPLLHRAAGRTNNILSYSVKWEQQNRFNGYLCRSQDNFGFDPFGDYAGDGTDRKNEVTDGQIRSARYLEIQAEESMNDQECKERAAEESNIRRANGTEHTAVVAGVTQSDGTLWDFGQFVDIIDDFADISGEFLIKSVEYAIDTRKGTRTRLVSVPPDAYQVEAEPTKADARKAKTGTGFQNIEPVEQGQTVR